LSLKQADWQAKWGRPAFGQREGLAGFVFCLQMIEDLLDHRRILDAGNDFDGAVAGAAGLDTV